MRFPTIKDVAKEAGVGIGTVSRVLNGSDQVKPETRERVRVAMEKLNYRPNLAARQLSGGRTYTIGVLSPFFTHPSFVLRLAGVQDALDETEYDLVLYSIKSPRQLIYHLHNLTQRPRFDGLIAISLHIEDEILADVTERRPMLVVDDNRNQTLPGITIDNIEGGYLATKYLIERGHTQIGFLGDEVVSAFGFATTRDRYEGYQKAHEEYGLPLNENWLRFGEHYRNIAHQHALSILDCEYRPTAVFASTDTKALGVMAAAQELGLRVPEDVAVIGFDDIEVASFINLTTINQSLFESGQLAGRMMLAMLGAIDEPFEEQVVLPLSVVERGTV